MTSDIQVHKLDEKGVEVWAYPAATLERSNSFIRLEARFDRDDVSAGPLLLEREDLFVETFFFDRWYNVFEVFDHASGEFKGWYCNISRPARVEGQHLYAEDLALDLVVTPDGSYQVLDQNEFEQLQLTEEDRLQALQTLHRLQEQAINRSGMFATSPEY